MLKSCLPCSGHMLSAIIARTSSFNVVSQGSGTLLLKTMVEGRQLQGELRKGTGKGADFWYANLLNYLRIHVLTMRFKETREDGEVQMWLRQEDAPTKSWGPLYAATRRASVETLSGLTKQAKAVFHHLRVMYSFAMIAGSQKWLPQNMTVVDVAAEMCVDAVKNEKNSFNEWYSRLVSGEASILRRGLELVGLSKGFSKEDVKKMIIAKADSGVLTQPEYYETLGLCREQLLSCVDKRMQDFAEMLFAKATQSSMDRKLKELEFEKEAKRKELSDEWRAICQNEVLDLAPENPKRCLLRSLKQRFSGNFEIGSTIEVEGAPKLYCSIQQFKVEKQCFEQGLSSESRFQLELEPLTKSLQLNAHDPDCVSLLGSLGQDRFFAVVYQADRSIKVYCHPRQQQGKELMHVKRAINAVAFNETLRMLALYSAESKTVAVYTWDEHFSWHSEFCAPIHLETYKESAVLVQMHFLLEAQATLFRFPR